MQQTPCQGKRSQYFIDVQGRDAPSTRYALSLCKQCPLVKQCAKAALDGGASLDRSLVATAVSVIQAGVYCDGSPQATRQLMEIAGVETTHHREHRNLTVRADHCVSCGRPMVKWHRGQTPEGFVKHYARNYCEKCRPAYQKAFPPGKRGHRGLRKQIDRHRHSAPPRTRQVITIQPALFELSALT